MAEEAARAYPNDMEVLLSVGRMLLAHGQLQMAKRHLLGAAKVSAEPRAPRLLGEVLLRQGDAKRAVRALQRAIQLGATDEETQGWYESANAYVNVQAEEGREAVARVVDEGFRSQEHDHDIQDDDSEDDAPTMVATAQPEAVRAAIDEAEVQTRQVDVQVPGPPRYPRPERPAVPRDDEQTDFVQLSRVAQDGAPTRQKDVPAAIRPAAGVPATAGAGPRPLAEVAPPPQDDHEIEDESTAIMSASDIHRLNSLEARKSAIGTPLAEQALRERERAAPAEAKKPASVPPPVPPPPPPLGDPKPGADPKPKDRKPKISDEDSDDAWHLAVKKGPVSQRPPSVPVSVRPSRRKRSGGRTGLYIGGAMAAILLTLFAGIRTGRLPEIAQHLPSWLSGTPDAIADTQAPGAQNDPAADDGEPAKPDEPATKPAGDKPAPNPPATNGDKNGDKNKVDNGKEKPAPAEKPAPDPRPKTVYVPRPTPRPTPRPKADPAPKPDPKPKPAPRPDPGGVEEPLWLGDPERN